jgi:hypothetical protein
MSKAEGTTDRNKRRRIVLSDDSISSNSGGQFSIGRSVVLLPTPRSTIQRSSSRSSSSASEKLSPTKNIRHSKNNKRNRDDDEDDSFSVDTAELVRTILRQKPFTTHVEGENVDYILPIAKNDNNIDTDARLSFENGENSHHASDDRDCLMNDGIWQCAINRDFTSFKLLSQNVYAENSHRDDDKSVETVELVRRIRLPLEHPPCKNIYFTANVPPDDKTITRNDRVQVNHSITAAEKLIVVTKTADLYEHIKNDGKEEFVMQEEVKDEFVLLEEIEEEFILPDQSVGSDSSCSNCDLNDDFDVSDAPYQQQRPSSAEGGFHSRNVGKNQSKVPLKLSHQRVCCKSCNESIQSTTIQSRVYIYPDEYTNKWIENAAFGFNCDNTNDCTNENPRKKRPNLNSAVRRSNEFNPQRLNGHHDDKLRRKTLIDDALPYGIVREGLHSRMKIFSPRILSNSTTGIENILYPTRISGKREDANIENFSDDEYGQAFGFGNVANTLLERRQSNTTSKVQNIQLQPCTPSNDATMFQPRANNCSVQEVYRDMTKENIIARSSMHISSNQNKGFNSVSIRAKRDGGNTGRTTQQPPSSSFSQPNMQRPRRIRDPSVRPISVVQHPSKEISTNPFRNFSNSATSKVIIAAPVTVNLEAGYTTASAWRRNDVFGGSGVGAGSYQIRDQSQPTTDDNCNGDVSSIGGNEEESAVPQTLKTRIYKKSTGGSQVRGNKVKSKKSNRVGKGRRGKWGWKNKKHGSNGKNNANNRNGQRRVNEGWAGNSDDPQLRHVGGAEMSF